MDALRAADASLFGKSRFEKWRDRFEAQWNAPDMVMVDAIWQSLPEDVRQSIRMVAPPELTEALEGGQYASPAMVTKHHQSGIPADGRLEPPAASLGLRTSPEYEY